MDFNGDFKYDLALGQLGEGWVGNMLTNKTIEVKFDFACYRTGNFYIEYESRGKPSGLATSKADYWMLIAATEEGCRLKKEISDIKITDIMFSLLINTNRLKKICRENHYRMGVKGGDDNTSLGVLIKATSLIL
jgi:hypothetical protein